jgi:hypothetical protein
MKKVAIIYTVSMLLSVAGFSQKDTSKAIKDTVYVVIQHRIDTLKVDINYYGKRGNVKYLPLGGYIVRTADYCQQWPEGAKNVVDQVFDHKFRPFTGRILSVSGRK